jgi:hypothetical protein
MQRFNDLKELQKPYIEAKEKANQSSSHLMDLCNNDIEIENPDKTKTKLSKEQMDSDLRKFSDEICDVWRPNSRGGIFAMYMLHKGMSLDDICSTDPKFDAEKKAHIAECHGFLMKATNTIAEAEKIASDKAGLEFDKALDREKFIKDYKSGLSPEETEKLSKLKKEDYDKHIDKEIARARHYKCVDAASAAKRDTIDNSPVLKEFKETYLKMGVAVSNLPFPAKPMTDMNALTKNHDKMVAMSSMSINYGDMISVFGKNHGLDQKTVDNVLNATDFMDRVTYSAIGCNEHVISDGFADITKANPGIIMTAKGALKMLPDLDKAMKGKNTFAEIAPGKGKEMFDVTMRTSSQAEKELFTGKFHDLKDPGAVLNSNLKDFKLTKEVAKELTASKEVKEPSPQMGHK